MASASFIWRWGSARVWNSGKFRIIHPVMAPVSRKAYPRMFRRPRLLALLLALLLIFLAAVVTYTRFRPVPSLPDRSPQPALTMPIDRILIEKSARRLTVFRDGKALRSYPIALGFAPEGDKQREGDGKTPEGIFTINRRNPQSRYHLSLGIDYPRPQDIARARAEGADPGGDIFIHGQPNGLGRLVTLTNDWTAGCIALSNAGIEELWRITPIGTEVEIRP